MDTFRDSTGSSSYADKGAAKLSETAQPNITAFSIGAPKPLKGSLEPVPSSLASPITVLLDSFGACVANAKIKKVKTYAFPKKAPTADPEFNLREPFPSTVSNLTVGVVDIPKDHSAELTALAASAKQIFEKATRDNDAQTEEEFGDMHHDLLRLAAISSTRPLSPSENNTVASYRQRINDELNQRGAIPNGAPAPVEPDDAGSDAGSVRLIPLDDDITNHVRYDSRAPSVGSHQSGSVGSHASSHSGSVGSLSSIHSMDSSSWSALSLAPSLGSLSQSSSMNSSLGSALSSRGSSQFGSVISVGSDQSVGSIIDPYDEGRAPSQSSRGSSQYFGSVDTRGSSQYFGSQASRVSASSLNYAPGESKYATPAPQYGKPSPHHHLNLLTLSSRNWGMPDFSPIKYPNIANFLETPEEKYATPMRVNQAPEWVIGDEISQHGSERSVDSTKLDTEEQEKLKNQLMTNYRINELKAISKEAGIKSRNRGRQKKEQIAARLVNNQNNPRVRDAILVSRASSAKKQLGVLQLIHTPVKGMKTRAKAKAFTPGSIQRVYNSKPAGASSPMNLFTKYD